MKRPSDKTIILAFAILAILLVMSTTAFITRASASGNGGTWTDGYNAGMHDGQQSGYASGYNKGKYDAAVAANAQIQQDKTNAYNQGVADAKNTNYSNGRVSMYHEIFNWMEQNCKTEYVSADAATEMVCFGASQPADIPSP